MQQEDFYTQLAPDSVFDTAAAPHYKPALVSAPDAVYVSPSNKENTTPAQAG
jgi:hypothetical protein